MAIVRFAKRLMHRLRPPSIGVDVFPWAHYKATAGALTMHTLLALNGNIPNSVHLNDGKMGAGSVSDLLIWNLALAIR